MLPTLLVVPASAILAFIVIRSFRPALFRCVRDLLPPDVASDLIRFTMFSAFITGVLSGYRGVALDVRLTGRPPSAQESLVQAGDVLFQSVANMLFSAAYGCVVILAIFFAGSFAGHVFLKRSQPSAPASARDHQPEA
jgi:hypothetical protein